MILNILGSIIGTLLIVFFVIFMIGYLGFVNFNIFDPWNKIPRDVRDAYRAMDIRSVNDFPAGAETLDPECYARPVVLVKLGETTLAVPRKLKHEFEFAKDQENPQRSLKTYLKQYCQTTKEPPFEITSASFDLAYRQDFTLHQRKDVLHSEVEAVKWRRWWEKLKSRAFNETNKTLEFYPYDLTDTDELQITLSYTRHQSEAYSYKDYISGYNSDIVIRFVLYPSDEMKQDSHGWAKTYKTSVQQMEEEAQRILSDSDH